MPALSRSFQSTWLNSWVRPTRAWSTEVGGNSETARRIFGAPRLMPVLNQSWVCPARKGSNSSVAAAATISKGDLMVPNLMARISSSILKMRRIWQADVSRCDIFLQTVVRGKASSRLSPMEVKVEIHLHLASGVVGREGGEGVGGQHRSKRRAVNLRNAARLSNLDVGNASVPQDFKGDVDAGGAQDVGADRREQPKIGRA